MRRRFSVRSRGRFHVLGAQYPGCHRDTLPAFSQNDGHVRRQHAPDRQHRCDTRGPAQTPESLHPQRSAGVILG